MMQPIQLRWDRAGNHSALLASLRLLNQACELDMPVLLSLHEILLPPSHPYRGRFRDSPLVVRFNGIVHWRPPPADEALRLMRATLVWINTSVKEGVTGDARDCAARVLFQTTDIHPFFDGNGRVARTLATWLLIKGGYALLMDPGSYCHQHRTAYYKALDSHSLDPTLWPKFFSQMVDYCFVTKRHSAACAPNPGAQPRGQCSSSRR
jgi:Fic family protein